MYFVAKRNGEIYGEYSCQDRLLQWVYGHKAGRIMLKPFLFPCVSKFMGKIMDSRVSAGFIPIFIRVCGIDMTPYKRHKYRSYNEFFKRKILENARAVAQEAEEFVSPCDGRLSVYPIKENSSFTVKHTRYTLKELLKSRRLAERFKGGYAWIYRLCVDDYHRYIYIDNGKKSDNYRIPGIFHTVNPAANDQYPIYKENTREFTLIASENFGTILQMEVGALLVGKIENRHRKGRVVRGQEKGNFAFGGSTIIILTQKDQVIPDQDLLSNSEKGIETKVYLGESVGRKDKFSSGITF